MTVAPVRLRIKMNAFQTRVFQLFYAGKNKSQIARLCNVPMSKVLYVFERFGDEWVSFHVPKEILDKLYQLTQDKIPLPEIAKQLNLTESAVRYTLNRLPPEYPPIKVTTKEEDRRLTIRCKCGVKFSTSLFELESNPTRQCKVCNANDATK